MIVFSIVVCNLETHGQSIDYCGSEYKETNPEHSTLSKNRNNSHTITVVFHILYENDADSLTMTRIYSQMDRLNADFNNQNQNLASVPSLFRHSIGKPNISFCLATRTPGGDATTGVNRVKTLVENIGNAVSVDGRPRIKYTSLSGQNAWNTEEYLNIWVGKRILFLGESTFPEDLPMIEQGIIIDQAYVGVNDHPQFGLGRVLTHEVGHYLGLRHLWGNNGSCGDDDGIEDTPLQEDPYFGCNSHPQISCGSADMIMNYMNTADDACMSFFTQEQVDMMHNVLNTSRKELSNNHCQLIEDPISLENIRIYQTLYGLTLDFQEEQFEGLNIQLFDLQGRLLYTQNIGRRFIYQLDTKHFSDGVYILRLAISESVMTKRINIHN